jgi:SAM-dependent methyltransferase
MSKKEWFASWFDTSFYHKLYRERNAEEARHFIQNLLAFIQLPTDSKVLDLACGKGRHSITLNELGMHVLGVDLSEKSIEFAKQFENKKLHFRVQDMRCPIENEKFDAIFNLFTSFGYFESDEENQKVLNCISSMLNSEGLFIFDYLNLKTTLAKLKTKESKNVDGIHFDITKNFDGQFFRKNISVLFNGETFNFEEKVRGFSIEEIEKMMQEANLKPIERFGDFLLNPYHQSTSDRLILICKKVPEL